MTRMDFRIPRPLLWGRPLRRVRQEGCFAAQIRSRRMEPQVVAGCEDRAKRMVRQCRVHGDTMIVPRRINASDGSFAKSDGLHRLVRVCASHGRSGSIWGNCRLARPLPSQNFRQFTRCNGRRLVKLKKAGIFESAPAAARRDSPYHIANSLLSKTAMTFQSGLGGGGVPSSLFVTSLPSTNVPRLELGTTIGDVRVLHNMPNTCQFAGGEVIRPPARRYRCPH